MILAADVGRYVLAHGRGVSDAAFGRVFSHSRGTYDDRDDYARGYQVGRFLLFDRLPAWRAPMVTHADAAVYLDRIEGTNRP